jgi:long-subunit fatty acid transport protein
MMLAIMSAIIATGLAVSTYAVPAAFAASSSSSAGSTRGAAGSASFADDFDTSSSSGAGDDFVLCEGSAFLHGAACLAQD